MSNIEIQTIPFNGKSYKTREVQLEKLGYSVLIAEEALSDALEKWGKETQDFDRVTSIDSQFAYFASDEQMHMTDAMLEAIIYF